jgi:multidrug efflux pump
MSYLPVTVIIVLSASLLTAMVFVPAVGFFIGRTDKETVEQFGHFADDEHADFRKMKGLIGFYLRFIERIIRHPLLVVPPCSAHGRHRHDLCHFSNWR